MTATRGIRGAISVEQDDPESIASATSSLLTAILQANPTLQLPDIASVFFTVTGDLVSAYPAAAARCLGWQDVPLICAREIDVPHALPRLIRVLLHWNTELPQAAIQHVYLGRANALRPDLSPNPAQVDPAS